MLWNYWAILKLATLIPTVHAGSGSSKEANIQQTDQNESFEPISVKLDLTKQQWINFMEATAKDWPSAEAKVKDMILNYTTFKNGLQRAELFYSNPAKIEVDKLVNN